MLWNTEGVESEQQKEYKKKERLNEKERTDFTEILDELKVE